jgi:hypothetical protein
LGENVTQSSILKFHPDNPPLAVTSISAKCWLEEGRWHFRYLVDGTARLVLPEAKEPGRANELWSTTCFEAFVGGKALAYREYNFSPSRQWAAYGFHGPRHGIREVDEAVHIWLDGGDDWIAVEASVSSGLAVGSPLNLTAVIEEEGGIRSYWALAHPDGPPDFHNRDCFVASLPPVEAA